MPFQPGKSGNPKGRPPKSRALTAILETELNTTVPTADGRRVAKKRIMARMVSELIATGAAVFPDGSPVRVDVLKRLDTVAIVSHAPPLRNPAGHVTTRSSQSGETAPRRCVSVRASLGVRSLVIMPGLSAYTSGGLEP